MSDQATEKAVGSPVRGHEDHWASAGVEDIAAIAGLVEETLDKGDLLSEDEVVAEWQDGSETKHVIVMHYPEADVCTVVHATLTDNEEDEPVVFSSLPMILGAYTYDIKFEASEEWSGPTVGLIKGRVEGREIEFLDPLYIENKPSMFKDEEITIALAGLAYEVLLVEEGEKVEYAEPEVIRVIRPAEETAGKTDEELEPVVVELEGSVLLLPVADADYELITEVFEIEEAVAFGRDFWKLTVGLWVELDAEGEDDENEEQVSPITVYVEKTKYPKEKPEEGDSLRMMVWLQGVVVDPVDEDDEEEEEEETA